MGPGILEHGRGCQPWFPPEAKGIAKPAELRNPRKLGIHGVGDSLGHPGAP
jgi:hypothetical protein